MIEPNLDELLAEARRIVMTPEQREEQVRSMAYGNAALENPAITREMIDDLASRDQG